MSDQDPAAAILGPAPVSDRVKATAWDAFEQSSNEDDLADRLKDLPLPDAVKADLWDAKRGTAAPDFTASNEKDANGDATAIGFGLHVSPAIAKLAKDYESQEAAAAERTKNWPANFASKLPRSLQYPVAAGLSLIPTAAEIYSVGSAAPTALSAGRAVTGALSKPADVAIQLLLKRLGFDAEGMGVQASRMRLQAARSQTRQGRIANRIAAASRPDPNESLPGYPRYTPSAEPAAAPAEPVVSGRDVPTRQGASDAPVVEQSPSAESAPRRNSMPDQKALNEEALTRRRAEYQAKVKAEAEKASAAKASDKPRMTSEESRLYLLLRAKGKTDQQATDAILAQRDLNGRLGLKTPSRAETQFPKGMRDYKTVISEPTPPTADWRKGRR